MATSAAPQVIRAKIQLATEQEDGLTTKYRRIKSKLSGLSQPEKHGIMDHAMAQPMAWVAGEDCSILVPHIS